MSVALQSSDETVLVGKIGQGTAQHEALGVFQTSFGGGGIEYYRTNLAAGCNKALISQLLYGKGLRGHAIVSNRCREALCPVRWGGLLLFTGDF